MLTAHGFWSPGAGLCLWAEDSERTVTSSSRAVRSARPHPFAAGPVELAELIPGHAPAGPAEAVTLLLPSLPTSPLDSPALIRTTPRPAARSAPSLLAWSVPVVRLSARAALSWLDRPRDEEATPVRLGDSIGYLADLAQFATELVLRGRVLPSLDRDGGGGAMARWRPVLQGTDVIALHALITATPPVCRAQPGLDNPRTLAVDALQGLVDAAVRGSQPAGLDLLPARRGRPPKRPPAHESWLAALTSADGRFDADDHELDDLDQVLRPWSEIGTEQVSPAHATFRLTELDTEELGPDAEPGWRLEFLLQSTADPSLLVPAEQAWQDEGALRRWLDRPQELLLAELGRASRVYPDLGPGMRQARPSALDLDATGAFHFLSVAAPALTEAGFGVLLPSWWGRRSKVGLSLAASTPRDPAADDGSRFGRDQLAGFQWSLAVGDQTLTEEEIEALVAAKAPLVRLRGQWFAVDPDQLRRGLEFLSGRPPGRMNAVELLALAAAHPDDNELPLEVTSIQADGWLGDLLSGTAAQSLTEVTPPAEFTAELRPYQQRGLSWLSFLSAIGVGAVLADDMGLGKTIQLLALEATRRDQVPDAGPTLLLCPMSLVSNWEAEAAKFAPALRVHAHHGRERLHGQELADRIGEVDLIVTTYGTATIDIEELAEIDWQRLVLDEAQVIKNRLSKTSKAARRLRAGQRVALTGTPVENALSELWSIMDFVNPGLLASPDKFRTRYAIPIERHRDADAAERLRKITRPYILRRLKTDPTIIDDLPDKIEINQYCQLTVEQASLYRTVVDDMMEKIDDSSGIERRGYVLATMAKLKQVCNHPAQLLQDRSPIGRRSGKVIRLEELLEEILAEGDRVLCFTQYTAFAELLRPHLAARFGTDVAYLHGGTGRSQRTELVRRFQSGEGPPIFLLSLKAGGTGLNLTAANHVIHLDRWWNPAVENQATDRAFRIGQRRNVQVRKFICAGTLEEKIDRLIADKVALAELVVGDGEGWLTELSTTELRDLFTLSAGAVADADER
ncbi:DEAD/DEAH box helicase [Microlunatus speluncae]|uniref:DEAD/DEAH box helicase n=1 Tax=Microlunatus speluncae TaxID=2594267 RepID=UPI0012661C95|nr:DEAD/DEAH box helicase [Microlunatus speluncae]